MSTRITLNSIHGGELFALPSGSVYQASSQRTSTTSVQARLWCAHTPDPVVFAPPEVDFAADATVDLLTKAETRQHLTHAGYVRTAFEHAMDQQHQTRMAKVNQSSRVIAERVQREQLARPWWKKLRG